MIRKNLFNIICAQMLFSFSMGTSLTANDAFSTREKAEFYHHNSIREWDMALEALKDFQFKGNESVLEIGCRGGRISAHLAGRVPEGKVIATEMRGPGAIQFALKYYPKALYPNLFFLEQNFLDSDYSDEFDFVFGFSSLHWHSDQAAALVKAYRALKKEGQVLFTIPVKAVPEIRAFFREFAGGPKWKEYLSNWVHPRKKFDTDEYRSMLENAGFTSIQIQSNKSHLSFENKKAFSDWFRSHSLIDSIPEDMVEEFLVDFVNSYAKYFMGPDGQIPFQYDELFIKGLKRHSR